MGLSTQKIVEIVIALIVISLILPVALNQFASVSTTQWDPTVATLWKNIQVFAMVGLVIYVLYSIVKTKGGG